MNTPPPSPDMIPGTVSLASSMEELSLRATIRHSQAREKKQEMNKEPSAVREKKTEKVSYGYKDGRVVPIDEKEVARILAPRHSAIPTRPATAAVAEQVYKHPAGLKNVNRRTIIVENPHTASCEETELHHGFNTPFPTAREALIYWYRTGFHPRAASKNKWYPYTVGGVDQWKKDVLEDLTTALARGTMDRMTIALKYGPAWADVAEGKPDPDLGAPDEITETKLSDKAELVLSRNKHQETEEEPGVVDEEEEERKAAQVRRRMRVREPTLTSEQKTKRIVAAMVSKELAEKGKGEEKKKKEKKIGDGGALKDHVDALRARHVEYTMNAIKLQEGRKRLDEIASARIAYTAATGHRSRLFEEERVNICKAWREIHGPAIQRTKDAHELYMKLKKVAPSTTAAAGRGNTDLAQPD